ncbi:MAG TPA: C40 family peptidase [Clostridiaceae bacterium]|nr:C40 family peptidase [Clostridiaceae bacterium]
MNPFYKRIQLGSLPARRANRMNVLIQVVALICFVIAFILYGNSNQIMATGYDLYKDESSDVTDHSGFLKETTTLSSGRRVKTDLRDTKIIRSCAQRLANEHRENELRQTIVQTALDMQGPQGYFDCSLFVQTVMAEHGIEVPRSTFEYSPEVGMPVAEEEILPGDIVLYDSMGGGTVTHVGIYVGENEVCHVNTVRGRILTQDLHMCNYPIMAIYRVV